MMTSQEVNVFKMAVYEDERLLANNFLSIKAREKLIAPSCLSRRDESKHISFDPERSRSRPDLRSRDPKGHAWSK